MPSETCERKQKQEEEEEEAELLYAALIGQPNVGVRAAHTGEGFHFVGCHIEWNGNKACIGQRVRRRRRGGGGGDRQFAITNEAQLLLGFSKCFALCECVECVSVYIYIYIYMCLCVYECAYVWHNLNERMTFITMHSLFVDKCRLALFSRTISFLLCPSLPFSLSLFALISLCLSPYFSPYFSLCDLSLAAHFPLWLRSKNSPFPSAVTVSYRGRGRQAGQGRGSLNLTNSCCCKSILNRPTLVTQATAKHWTCNSQREQAKCKLATRLCQNVEQVPCSWWADWS